MNESGLGDVAQFLSITMQGARFGFDTTKEAIRLMIKFLTWIYNSYVNNKGGRTSTKNVLERSRGDVQYFKVPKDASETKNFYKDLKKNGVPYTKLPTLNNSTDKEHEYIMYATCDAPRFNHCAEAFVNKFKDTPDEVGNVTFDEAMEKTGMSSISAEDFDKEMKKLFGEDYVNFEQIGELKKNEDTLDVSEQLDSLAESVYLKDNLSKEDTVAFNYLFNENKILNQTDSHIMLDLGEKTDFGVWIPKENIFPKIDENFKGDINLKIVVPKDSQLIIESVDPNDRLYLKSYAERFVEQLNKNYYENTLKTISIDSSLVKSNDNGNLSVRIPGTYKGSVEGEQRLTLNSESYKLINDDKTIVTKLDPSKEYEILYLKDGKKKKVKGNEILSHFDNVDDRINSIGKSINTSDILKNTVDRTEALSKASSDTAEAVKNAASKVTDSISNATLIRK